MSALAGNALTTLAAVKLAQGIADNQADDRLVLLINQASSQIESWLNRRLGKADYTETIPAGGTEYLILRQWPVLGITSLTQSGELIDPDFYSIDSDGLPLIYSPTGWPITGARVGLAYDIVRPAHNITVSYTAGYVLPKDATETEPATLPADLEGLCIELVLASYGKLTSGGMAGLRSFAISDVRWEWATDMPATWTTVLDAHKRLM